MRSGSGAPPNAQGVQGFKAAVVIIVVLVVGWILIDKATNVSKPVGPSASAPTQHKKSKSGATTLPPASTTTTTVALIPASEIKLQVLNGVGRGSLAGEWSTKLHTDFGYDTLRPDNATSVVGASTIYVITPGYLPEADALATSVGLTPAQVSAVTPATAPIPTAEKALANLVLVIGPNLASTA